MTSTDPLLVNARAPAPDPKPPRDPRGPGGEPIESVAGQPLLARETSSPTLRLSPNSAYHACFRSLALCAPPSPTITWLRSARVHHSPSLILFAASYGYRRPPSSPRSSISATVLTVPPFIVCFCNDDSHLIRTKKKKKGREERREKRKKKKNHPLFLLLVWSLSEYRLRAQLDAPTAWRRSIVQAERPPDEERSRGPSCAV